MRPGNKQVCIALNLAGQDADLLILNHELRIETVLAKGRVLVDRGKALIKGTFD